MFDPYEKWLGIPKDQRPVTYYRLLGISPEETDAAIIAKAAQRRAAQLKAHQEGAQAQIHSRVSKEIAQAKATLLDSARRQRYDSVLQKLDEALPTLTVDFVAPVAAAAPGPAASPAPAAAKKKK